MTEQTYFNEISTRIRAAAPEDAFVASDFVDIADINTVWQALARLETAHEIKRVLRGVYYKPTFSEYLGEPEAPSPHHVALALARKYNWTIAPSSITALNQLGLSSQVSSRWSYISNGPYKQYAYNNTNIEFKHRSNKEISGMSYKTAMVIQALRAIGKENINPAHIIKLKKVLNGKELAALQKEAQQTTAWIYRIIKQLAGSDDIVSSSERNGR